MNIFILDKDMKLSAKYHCDSHVNKMILECTQILCTTLWVTGQEAPYRKTHENHPCCVWARKSLSNWLWLQQFVEALHQEKIYRTGKGHKSAEIAKLLPTPNISDGGLTAFTQAMPDKYKNKDVIKAYRKYYNCDKKHLARWTNRPIPYWMNNN